MASAANYATLCGKIGLPPLQPRKPGRRGSLAAFFRRMVPIGHAIWLVTLAAGVLIGSHRVSAEDAEHPSVIHLSGMGQSLDPDLVLICPQGGVTQPQFESKKSGKIFPISDPRLKAIAVQACQSGSLAATESSSVNIVNNSGNSIYVGFTPQAGSSITWGLGCLSPIKGLTVEILANTTCQAAVTDSVANPGSRFCASTSLPPGTPPVGLDCSMAQQNHQTLIEAYFQPAPCFGPGTGNCIWYDVSVIPLDGLEPNCTAITTCDNTAWQLDQCKCAGGASYNLPVQLSCSAEPTLTCQGPQSTKYGSENYPSQCGNPNGTCVGNTQNCVNAFFYPMSGLPNEPNPACPNGQTLTMTFLSGP
jgi:hypothetical protein